MDKQLQEIYLREIAIQSHFAANAYNAVVELTSRLQDSILSGKGDTLKLHLEIFRSIHSLMTHTSNVSKMLWPAIPKRDKSESDADYHVRCSKVPKLARAAELQKILGLPKDGHPLKSRKLRDHLEHFDERLDNWQNTSIRKNFVNDSIGTREFSAGFDDQDVFRWYDPSKKQMLFRGETFDLEELSRGIDDILKRL